jgi:hypothetical protein
MMVLDIWMFESSRSAAYRSVNSERFCDGFTITSWRAQVLMKVGAWRFAQIALSNISQRHKQAAKGARSG